MKAPELKRGDTGPFVVLLGYMLLARGYTRKGFEIDGVFGEEIEFAVKKLQEDLGVSHPSGTPHGRFDQETQYAWAEEYGDDFAGLVKELETEMARATAKYMAFPHNPP